MTKFVSYRGVAAYLPVNDISTDAIIPAAMMVSTTVDLGEKLFGNWRYYEDGAERPEFVLNREAFRQSGILVSGSNFGCGSARESAVHALMKFGIKTVIAPSFGEIFMENAYQTGLLPIVLPSADYNRVVAALQADEPCWITVDLPSQQLQFDDGTTVDFFIAADRKTALLEGIDSLSALETFESENAAFEARDRERRPWIYRTVSRTGA